MNNHLSVRGQIPERRVCENSFRPYAGRKPIQVSCSHIRKQQKHNINQQHAGQPISAPFRLAVEKEEGGRGRRRKEEEGGRKRKENGGRGKGEREACEEEGEEEEEEEGEEGEKGKSCVMLPSSTKKK